MTTVNKSFTTTDSSSSLFIRAKDLINYSVSGTFVATIALEYSGDNSQSWTEITRFSATASGQVEAVKRDALYRLRCIAFTSGTAVTSFTNVDANDQKVLFTVGRAKAGTTAGWVVAAGDNICLATCPASQTASTLVLPLGPFNKGDVIKGFHLIGQIESGGNTATVDCVLKKHNAVAADVTTTTIASMTQISVTADAAITTANSLTDGFILPVAEDETYFMLVTATTGVATDIALQGFAIIIEK